jgi:hypothetical protein
MQHQIGTGSVQSPADRGADPFTPAGDQHHLAVHVVL